VSSLAFPLPVSLAESFWENFGFPDKKEQTETGVHIPPSSCLGYRSDTWSYGNHVTVVGRMLAFKGRGRRRAGVPEGALTKCTKADNYLPTLVFLVFLALLKFKFRALC
jgi:hypothetical protein